MENREKTQKKKTNKEKRRKEKTRKEKAAKEKKKPSHGVLSDFAYVVRTLWREFRSYLLVFWLSAVTFPVLGTVGSFISKYAVDAITLEEARVSGLIVLAGLIVLDAAARIGNAYCDRFTSSRGTAWCYWIFNRKLFEKRLSMDYQNMENTSVNDSFQKAHEGVREIDNSLASMRTFFDSSARVVIFSLVLARLTPVMIPITAIPAMLCFLANRHANNFIWKNLDKWTGLDRQLSYINSAAADFAYAKDVRLYGMSGWLGHKFEEIWAKRLFWHRKYDQTRTAWRIVVDVLPMISMLISYVVIVRMVFQGGVSAGDFVLYFSATQNYSGAIFDFAECISDFYPIRDGINYYRDYLDIPDSFNHGEGVPIPRGMCELSFRNVSYRYPNAEAPTLKNISFTLKKGEKLALVGPNGAGKSTLIKLMCGLYNPSEGEILLNGIDIRKFNREEYYSLFATVFQDFDILPVTVSQNITQSESAGFDAENVADALEKSGLYEKVSSLPQKELTLLAKSVYDDATDFSGGEMQKLALAKALYKNTPLLLLDEPTAALDPISEQEMYLRYADFAEKKSSVFISHRLASTRFCDNIIFLEDGRIAEEGTHAVLMKKGGRYAELFEIQSAYYKEELSDRLKEAAGL